MKSYEDLCKAVAEFERNASTLRMSSAALTHCRLLLAKEFPELFATMKHITFPSPSRGYDINLKRDIRDLVDRALSTCMSLDKELDKIDGNAIAIEYLEHISPRKSYTRIEWLLIYIHTAMDDMQLLESRNVDPDSNEDVQKLLNYGIELFDYIKGKLQSDALKQGLKALIKEQDHFRNSFMDFATIAIFCSSITATTLQFLYISTNSSFSSTVINVYWFASLVLSIASATNSFLGAIVHQSPNYLPRSDGFRHRVLKIWFGACPQTLLTISGILFLIGVCSFTFSSTTPTPSQSQGLLIKTVTIVLTSTNFLALPFMFLLAFTNILDMGLSAFRLLHHLAFVVVLAPIVLPYLIYRDQSPFGGFSTELREEYSRASASDPTLELYGVPKLKRLTYTFIRHCDGLMQFMSFPKSSPPVEIVANS